MEFDRKTHATSFCKKKFKKYFNTHFSEVFKDFFSQISQKSMRFDCTKIKICSFVMSSSRVREIRKICEPWIEENKISRFA